MIRNLYWEALRGERSLKIFDGGELLKDISHVNHCFDYIRQAIMCAGDMSIEAAAVLKSENEKPHINGMGNAHECKSWVCYFRTPHNSQYYTYLIIGSFKSLDGRKSSN
jgi:hypothetical protein